MSLKYIAFSVLFLAGVSAGLAQEIELETLESLPSPDVQDQVIGGEKMDPAKWPATLVFRNRGGGGCTATAIGDRVIITAAHCVDNGGTGAARVKGQSIRLACYHHPHYRPPQSYSADFALCLTEGQMPVLPFEVLNVDPSVPKLDAVVQLLGYGCLTIGGVDKTFGHLYGGTAKVVKMPGPGLYTVTEGGAAVCFGDSGGGSYVGDDVSRLLFAVNSRGNIKNRSFLSTISSPIFLAWAEDWAVNNEVEICGLTQNSAGCSEQ
ncbi:putative Peptidase S1 (Chymotrypsin) family protein [Mesorhizobium prunaredense]|uniref:Putative Peptidase S1 (Chymotrypsin) family protein n=1 Tax=Mesorhizobium prunaredense TaxID=1631249 RepID=A0A1R3VIV2_9HYPH|nr:trypsin-like serine protease [Mesorhizobium prunaredense]SIT58805.1 putative Peptidase S1 (Chymotrypsin) family protein [Mesorhizobium prunaredense]